MMKFSLKREWFPILVILASIVIGAYFYQHLPERIVSHWGIRGEPNGWSGKFQGSWLWPILLSGMYLMFWVFPFIDPKRERYVSFAHIYGLFRDLIMLTLFVIFVAAGLFNLGYNISIAHVVSVVIGAMMIVMGNYMGKIKMNWFMGVRTPWALSSEEVWTKTNRFGGWMMILFGIIVILAPFLSSAVAIAVFVFGALAVTVGSYVYSYIVYRKEKKKLV